MAGDRAARARRPRRRGLALAPRLPGLPRVPRRGAGSTPRVLTAGAALVRRATASPARTAGSPGAETAGAVRPARRAAGRHRRRARRGRDRRGSSPPAARSCTASSPPPTALRREVNGDEVTLRRHAERQLHERLLLQVRLLRVLEGEAGREPARPRVRRPDRGDRPPVRTRPGSAARSRSASRAGSTRLRRRLLRRGRARRSSASCRTCTCTRSRRSRSGRARPRSACRSTSTSRACATPASRRCPGTAAEILDDEVRARALPGQGATRRSGSRCTRPRTALGLRSTATIMFGHVDTPRELGAPPAARARAAAADGRLHRARAAAVRAHGGADLPEGPGALGPDVPRGAARARGRAARAASLDHEHPGLVGEARPRRRRGGAARRRATTSAGR